MISGLVVDNFAGGGGASTGIARAIGRDPDVAINHDPDAVAMHRANHPATEHLCQNVWQVDPREIRRRGPIALAWFSPDCTHFSKAKGGQPVKRNIRDLAWVVVLWAERAKPAVIMLENVEEFAEWGPLIDAGGGKLMPCPERRGLTFRRWVGRLRALGYRVEWRELRAADYGTPTIRKRLFLIARRDGLPIVWPAPTHARGGAGGLPAWRSAAECIDWAIPVPSIFERARPLADATLRRIARGVMRYVVNAAQPFIVPVTHQGDARVHPVSEPLRTVTTAKRGEHAIVVPSIVGVGQSAERSAADPLATITATKRGMHGLVAAFLAQHNGGATGHRASAPLSTITQLGTQQQLVAAVMHHAYTSNTAGGEGNPAEPARTVTARGQHHALVAAFLAKYYGAAIGQGAADPLHSTTSKARFGLVTVTIDGVAYVIADIGMRMLAPRELFTAQGFPAGYVIDPIGPAGKPLTKTAQIRACGNSVCPQVAAALVRANLSGAEAVDRIAAA